MARPRKGDDLRDAPVSLRVERSLRDDFDAVAARSGRTRSEAIEHLMRRAVENDRRQPTPPIIRGETEPVVAGAGTPRPRRLTDVVPRFKS